MSQQKSNKRRGAAWEIDLADWFMEQGLNAQRLPRAGRNDVGDVYVPGVNGAYVVEAKAPRRDGRIDLSGWIREAEIEAENYRVAKRLAVAPTPLVIIKASNKGVGEAWQSVRCAFHNDHVKSARLNIDNGGFRCFACDMAGDVYSLIMKREGVTYGEALKIAERITGESNGELRRKPKRGAAVPDGSRYNRGDSAYVPPRLRGES